jgi:hypothetical protein
MVLVSLLSGCQSLPATDVFISSKTSILAVDVLFPIRLSRDPSLVQVFFVKGPIHGGLDELPELIPASFVKWSRAYLLDPDPGTYSVVAVTSAYAPPLNDRPIAGVTDTIWSGTSSDAMIFPAELIHRTTTTIAPGRVAFMGALRVRRGDRINAKAVIQDDLQRRIAERLRPGATSESGLAGWLKRTRMVNLEKTSLSNAVGDRESFYDDALADLGDSPWARVIARAAPREATVARSTTQVPRPKSTAPIPEAAPAKPQLPTPESDTAPAEPQSPTAEPEAAPAQPQSPTPELEAAAAELQPPTPEPLAVTAELQSSTPEPAASPPSPKPRRFPGLPPGSLLSEIEFGMSHRDVRKILGAPDDRIDRLTAKAWIPFYTGPGANLREWIYEGKGRVVFSLHKGQLKVLDVVYDPDEGK